MIAMLRDGCLYDLPISQTAHTGPRGTPAHRARFEGLHVGSPTQALDATTAQVTLASQVQPQFLPWGVAPLTLSIEVTSAARAD